MDGSLWDAWFADSAVWLWLTVLLVPLCANSANRDVVSAQSFGSCMGCRLVQSKWFLVMAPVWWPVLVLSLSAPSGVIVVVLARTLFWLIQTLLSPSDLMGGRCWSSCRSSISPETGFCSALVQLTEAWYVSWLIQPIVASL